MPDPIRPELEVIAANLRESAYTAEELGDDGLCSDLSRAAEDIERHVAATESMPEIFDAKDGERLIPAITIDPNVTFALPPLSRTQHKGRVVHRPENS